MNLSRRTGLVIYRDTSFRICRSTVRGVTSDLVRRSASSGCARAHRAVRSRSTTPLRWAPLLRPATRLTPHGLARLQRCRGVDLLLIWPARLLTLVGRYAAARSDDDTTTARDSRGFTAFSLLGAPLLCAGGCVPNFADTMLPLLCGGR